MSIKTSGVNLVVILAFSTLTFIAGMAMGKEKSQRLYELRTYTTMPGKLPALNQRFREHTLKLFEKHGMKNEMYWIPTDESLKDNTLIYVVSHDNQAAADKSWKEFGDDPEWIKVRDASEADGKILAKPPERIFMRATDYSPVKTSM